MLGYVSVAMVRLRVPFAFTQQQPGEDEQDGDGEVSLERWSSCPQTEVPVSVWSCPQFVRRVDRVQRMGWLAPPPACDVTRGGRRAADRGAASSPSDDGHAPLQLGNGTPPAGCHADVVNEDADLPGTFCGTQGRPRGSLRR